MRIVVLVVVSMLLVACGENTTQTSNVVTTTSLPSTPVDTRKDWYYSDLTDTMTGEAKGGKARVFSEDGSALIEVYFGPKTKDIIFVEIKNKIINFGVDGTSVRIKVDGKVINAHFDRPADGSYDYGGIHESWNPGLIKKIFAGGKIQIEVPIYQNGYQIYTWDVKPFNPKDPWNLAEIKKQTDEKIAKIKSKQQSG